MLTSKPSPPDGPIAQAWLEALLNAFAQRSVQAIAVLFLPNGWLRDELVFSWNTRALGGQDAITSYLAPALSGNEQRVPRNLKLAPELLWTTDSVPEVVELAFTFETDVIWGRGIAKLVKDGNDKWKAQLMFVTAKDLKRHEEVIETTPPKYLNAALLNSKVGRIANDREPYVVVVGAGQTGLQVAARLKQHGVPTIVLEQSERVGDQWRKRYHGLTLNTPRARNTLLYQPYPSTWPIYASKDKMANWLEQYALLQDLDIWTSSYISPKHAPSYDTAFGRWALNISHEGRAITLHPAHVVFATGTLGRPYTPSLPGSDLTNITTVHAFNFQDASSYANKRVLVVGAGNTAADLCIALHTAGTSSVTMIQRSPTPVITPDVGAGYWATTHPEGVDTSLADFRFAARPWGMVKMIAGDTRNAGNVPSFLSEGDLKIMEGLDKAGYKVSEGELGLGAAAPIMERFAGYLLENGIADLLINGSISVKSGVTLSRLTEASVVFSDGSELATDAIIFATGYGDAREPLREVFGSDTIDQAGPFWGADEEGELRGVYRPTGHPGIWYAAGDFIHSRWGSKQLALHLKARMVGLTK